VKGRTNVDIKPEEIEELNAYGPYVTVWRGRGVTISQEEGLSGRSDILAQRIREVLLGSYSREDMAQMSLADIGCYDGWLVERLSDLPFKRMVGIEPRARNIEKGRKVRQILGIDSRVELRVGTLESLGEETFDVVVCAGLFHHLESLGAALRKLRSICRRKLFIESMCLSSRHMSADFVRELEPKDIVYFGKPPIVGLSGHKLESSYYHGSAIQSMIVSVPTLSALRMFVEQAGFGNVRVLIEPSAYWGGKGREGKACCLVADCAPIADDVTQAEQILSYEKGVLGTLLPARPVETWFARLCQGPSGGPVALSDRVVIAYATGPAWLARPLLRYLRRAWRHPFEFEIIKNLRYAPADKIALEMAKLRLAAGDAAGCIEAARRITGHVNADWRATYRAFLLLSRAYERLGDGAAAKRYAELCRISNPELPDALFHEPLFAPPPA
jgi:Methyltransferase domain